jgi:hypothetical protein
MGTPRIITLAQFYLLPIGTIVSPVKMTTCVHNVVLMDIDVQGVLQVEPEHRLVGRDNWSIRLRPVRPDISIVNGRLRTSDGERSYSYPYNLYPHRFVVWED